MQPAYLALAHIVAESWRPNFRTGRSRPRVLYSDDTQQQYVR
jgi:hypothetical protein